MSEKLPVGDDENSARQRETVDEARGRRGQTREQVTARAKVILGDLRRDEASGREFYTDSGLRLTLEQAFSRKLAGRIVEVREPKKDAPKSE